MKNEPTWLEVERLVRANPDGMTLEEIGQVFGCTRERVRQIEHKALRKLGFYTVAAELEDPPEVEDERDPDLPEGW